MKDMADEMTCDASYITALVDRLEELGLAERRPSAVDRRVKEVALTAKGEQVAEEITGTMRTPPAEFDALDAKQRRSLARLMGHVVTDLHPLTDPFRPLSRR
jgi:DNA-binding MarR family transcriptional regulator